MNEDSELFRHLVAANTDGLWLLDDDGRTLYANARMAELLGRTPEEMEGLSAFDVHDEAGKEQFAAHLAKARAGDPGHDDLETMYLRRDGEPIWLLTSWRPVHDDDGRLLGYLHRYTDYTERRELLGTLRYREQMLRVAQAIAAVGSWDWDLVTDKVIWSDQLHQIHGTTPAEFEPSYESFLEFVHPEDRDQVARAVDSVFTGADEYDFTVRIIRRDGSRGWIQCLGMVARDPEGTPVRLSGTAQDVTEKVRADRAIAAAAQRTTLMRDIAAVANNSSSLVEALRRTGKIVNATPGWDALFTYLPGPDGRLAPQRLTSNEPPLDLAPDADLAETCRRSGKVTVVAAPGHEQTHSRVALPVQDDGGVSCVVEVVGNQVPPLANALDLISHVADQLSRVAERERAAAELAEARDQAMAASRLKSEFLATMSHEIRTPMNGVIGLTDLLLRTDLDSKQRRLAEGLHGAGLTLRGLINDILDLSKIEAGKLELELVDFEVRAVVEQTMLLLRSQADDKGLDLRLDVAEDVPTYVRGDAVRWGQVITNIGSNAVKFTEAGRVRIAVSLARIEASGPVLQVTVEDTGPGIPEAARAQLFEAFSQADPSTTRRHGGTGLGLTISQQLVAALGGELSLESEVGRGSTFWFTAAFRDAAGDSRDHHRHVDPERPVDASSRTVLVVEDNQVNQMVAVGLLESGGFTVDVASDGVEAVRALTGDHPYDAVLMDCRMPHLDGFEATRAVRAQEPPGIRVPIIAMTASALEGERERCLAAGMDDFLTKPVDAARLNQTVWRWTDGARGATGDDGAEPAAEEAEPQGVVDLDRIDMLHEMVKDGVSLFQRSSGNFLAHAEDHLTAIGASVEAKDADQLMATAHKLKGSALNLGLPRVGAAAFALEERGRTGRLEGAELDYQTLVADMKHAVDALGRERAARS